MKKVCTLCGKSKPFSEYYKQREGKYGLRARCRTCLITITKSKKYKTKKKKRLSPKTVKRLSLLEKGLQECTICKHIKKLSEFNTSKKATSGHKSNCKPCEIEYQRVWFNQLGLDKKIYIYNYLEKHPCADCGNTNVMELEFDHFRDKSFNIGRAHIERRTLVELKREIKKCVVRCANCHTVKTHIEQNTWKHVMNQERNQK